MKKENFNEKINFLITLIYYGLIIATIFFIIKFILPFLTPFLAGFSIAFLLRPFSKKFSRKTKLNKKLCNILVILLFYVISTIFLWLIGLKIFYEVKSLFNSSQEIYENYILPFNEILNKNLTNFFNEFLKIPKEQTENILRNIIINLNNIINSNFKYFLTIIAKFSTSIPEFFISLIFTIISSVYFSYDYEKITIFITNLLPEKVQNFIFKTKKYTIKTIIKYFKSYIFLTFLSFILFTIGFFIVKIKNPIGTAAIICIFDSIPLIGSGIIIIPWVLILFAENNVNLAISLLIVFLIATILRSILEPKILGVGLGLHPLSTLISIYIGTKTFGFLGIILAPIVTNICFLFYKSNQDEKKSHKLNPIKN